MFLYKKDQIDPDLDYQIVDCGAGLLESYSLGRKTGSYQIGEIAIRNIRNKIAFLAEDQAQRLVQDYCSEAQRIRSFNLRA